VQSLRDKEKKGEDNMVEKQEIVRSITDEDWMSEEELGVVEKVIEYHTGKDSGKGKVKVKAKVLSGSQSRTIEVAHTSMVDNELKLDQDAFIKDLIRTTFGLTEQQYVKILSNKSGDLMNQIRTLALEMSGISIDDEEKEKEKN
jgi:hypothetical protein